MYDILIIGAGPGGMSAAIYGARANMNVAIIDKEAPGGKVLKTDAIENYPGFNSVNGADLASKMFEQVVNYGTEFIFGEVVKVNNFDDHKEVVMDSGEVYEAKTIIIATGNENKKMGLDREDYFYAKGLSYCAICDGALYKGKEMAVIGGGNSALQEALFLTNFAKKVYIIHRRDQFRGESTLVDRVKSNDKIELLLNYIPYSLNGDKHVTGLTIQNKLDNSLKTLDVEILFPFIGFEPKTDFVKHLGILDEQGYVLVDENMKTSLDGIYSVGDVNHKNLRQIVTACNDGAIAAIAIQHYLQNK